MARRYGGFLYTVAYRLTGDADDAQDLVQEVLLRVRRGLASYRPGTMEGWLSRITTNAFLDEVRRRRRRPVEALGDRVDEPGDPAPGADEALAATTLGEDVQAAIRRLPPDHRAVLVLSDVVGLGYTDIADALSIPVGTVRSRLHRARAKVRAQLDGSGR
ncbi:MAG TPA: sigma-70 family RNA polymerase sigma factor [Acidimicrobiales bacterium]